MTRILTTPAARVVAAAVTAVLAFLAGSCAAEGGMYQGPRDTAPRWR